MIGRPVLASLPPSGPTDAERELVREEAVMVMSSLEAKEEWGTLTEEEERVRRMLSWAFDDEVRAGDAADLSTAEEVAGAVKGCC
jgi:hypothetical protein